MGRWANTAGTATSVTTVTTRCVSREIQNRFRIGSLWQYMVRSLVKNDLGSVYDGAGMGYR
jgi:hypothetical protein